MKGLLDGVTVLDLTRVVSGPSCTRSLADLGAEVIKIEPPEGDMWRRGLPRVGNVSVGFAQMNAGKRFLSVDLRTKKGQEIVFKLALQCDVIVENYRPGVAAKLGLGYEAISKEKPEIIYCSISGYGQEGPARGRRAYAPIIHAEVGLLHQNAREWGIAPLAESASHADIGVGMQASIGILAALFNRQVTGEGVHVDASMAETMLAMNESTAVETNGGLAGKMSPFRPGKAPVVKVKNGDYAQLPGNPSTMIFAVARAFGKAAELEALGWTSPTAMTVEEAAAKLSEWALEFDDVDSLGAALDSIRVPVGAVKPLADSANADWAIYSKAFTDVDSHDGTIKVPTSPLRVSNHQVGPRGGAYALGDDNRALLKARLGLDDDEIDMLEKEDVLISERNQETDSSPF